MKNENRFILELIKGTNADTEGLAKLMKKKMDYPYILGQLLYNRVGAIAYLTLKKKSFCKMSTGNFAIL